MNIAFVYVTDEAGYELAQHSIVSLALSQPAPCNIQVYCYKFTADPSDRFATALAALGAKLTFKSISNPAVERHPTFGHVTTPTLLKLSAVSELIDHYDRVVYLDNDILVFSALNIDAIEFGDAPIAAVVDMDLSATGALRHSTWSPAGGESNNLGDYFNAGFMIFASENWRAREFLEKYSASLDRHEVACPYKVNCTSIDQCGLNRVFEKVWLKLPVSYNMQAGAKFTDAWKNAAVRHYCGNRKFIPIVPFRNDGRDVRRLNEIRRILGLSTVPLPFIYEIPFRLNIMRKYRSDSSMRRFLRKVQSQHSAPFTAEATESRLQYRP